jgi:hypothetical protein
MNFSKLFYSFFSILVATFFVLFGMICLMTPWIPAIKTQLVVFLLENTVALSLFGLVLIIIGIAIVANILLFARHRYYKIKCGTNGIDVDESAIQQYVDRYLSELFPGFEVPSKLLLKKNTIHVFAYFPYLPLEEQKSLLTRIENDLIVGFEKMLGYKKEFYLSASFREEPLKQ